MKYLRSFRNQSDKKLKLTVPRGIHGTGEHLPIDRLTSEINPKEVRAEAVGNFYDDVYKNISPAYFYNQSPENSCENIGEERIAFNAISEIFVRITRGSQTSNATK